MTPDDFRAIALSFPSAIESAHMDHPDFRMGGKIFATLGYPDSEWGCVMLPLDEQARLLKSEPKVFAPAKGAWGRAGSTLVHLQLARKKTVAAALRAAWEKRSSTAKSARTSKRQ